MTYLETLDIDVMQSEPREISDMSWCGDFGDSINFPSNSHTLRETNIAMENGPFEDVFPIGNGDIPWLYVHFPDV